MFLCLYITKFRKMRWTDLKKEKSIRYILNFSAFLCFIFALALVVLLRLFKIEPFLEWYSKYTDTLMSYEIWMQSYGASAISVIFILLNYTVKAIIPWFPISCICVVSGALFSWYYAIIINIAGLIILFSIKFFWGRKFGGGNAEKILRRYDTVYNFIDKSKTGSPLVLFVLRFMPSVPVNSVSGLYGATDISYTTFICASLGGFAYKLFSYTVIGRNVFDPASASFIMPFITLSVFSGIALLAISGVLSITPLKNK